MKNNKKKLIIIIVSIILAIIVIPTTIYCISNSVSPIGMVSEIFSSNEKEIVGKWQSENKATAYEFYDDGTYDSYISSFSYSGNYSINGNEITLNNAEMSGNVTYKLKIKGKNLSLKLVKENGVEVKEKDVNEYKKVDVIKTTSISDLLDKLTTTADENSTNQ